MNFINGIFSLYKHSFKASELNYQAIPVCAQLSDTAHNNLLPRATNQQIDINQAIAISQVISAHHANTADQPNVLNCKPVTDKHNNTSTANKKAAISILGLGYVGAVSTACFSQLGHRVIGVDPDAEKVNKFNNAQAPVLEKGLNKLIAKGCKEQRISATQDVLNAVLNTDITLVSVGTPSDEEGGCDLAYLKIAAKQIGIALQKKQGYHCVIFRSTVPPGTTRDVLLPILEQYSCKVCGTDFGLCFNPEFLRESTAIADFFSPAKTVIGAWDQRSADTATALYSDVSGEIFITDLQGAEFVKYIDNTWHALKVTFGNEIGRLCKAMDVDSHAVMEVFSADTKLNISSYYLKPGFAFGGSCLPKDTKGMMHLAKKLAVDVPVIDQIMDSNEQHIQHALKLIKESGVKSVGIVGLTFKADTDDLRNSPALDLLKTLDDQGYNLSYLDKNVDEHNLIKQGVNWHLSLCGSENAFTLINRSELLVFANNYPNAAKIAARAAVVMPVLDLVGLQLDESVTQNKNYTGLCW